MNKKVVVFGGGTGMSYLLRGLKEYPLDLTAVVSVCDDGGSTGILRDEFNILAVGDIRKVLVSLASEEGNFEKLLNYRFTSDGTLNKHTVGNILLAAQTEITGSVQKAIESLGDILKLRGKVMPFTEDNVTLIGRMEDGTAVVGEHNITESPKKIMSVCYDKEPTISDELLYEIQNADVILLSMGSLFTSVIPNLLSQKVRDAIDNSNAKIIYSCNLFTQPGETDDFTVSDHVKVLNQYLGSRKIEYVVANDGFIDGELAHKYATTEQKDPVVLDEEELNNIGVNVISDDLVYVKEHDGYDVYRHNYLKLGFLINTVSMNYDYMIRRKK